MNNFFCKSFALRGTLIIMALGPMKPIHLLTDELNYELRIRGITCNKDASQKRKMLTRLLDRDKGRPDIEYRDPLYQFATERAAITNTISSIRDIIHEFEGPESDSVFKRISSRIIHVTDRVKRIEPEDRDAENFKDESLADCLELEVQLFDKVVKEDNAIATSNHNQTLQSTVIHHCGSGKRQQIHKLDVSFSAGNKEDVLLFLERVEELCLSRGIDHRELYDSAVDLFRGDALLWYRSIKSQVRDWDTLAQRLKEDFLPSDFTNYVWDEIRNRRQKKDESVQIFVALMESLFSRLHDQVDEASRVKHIKRNMLPHYITQLALTPINTITDLVKKCRMLDEARTQASTSNSPKLFSVESEVHASSRLNSIEPSRAFSDSHRNKVMNRKEKNPSNTVCWNCSLPNHRYKSCTAKRNKFCYKCGKANVTVKQCKCSKNE